MLTANIHQIYFKPKLTNGKHQSDLFLTSSQLIKSSKRNAFLTLLLALRSTHDPCELKIPGKAITLKSKRMGTSRSVRKTLSMTTKWTVRPCSLPS